MFSSPLFGRSSLFSDPFSDWDSLLQRQWQEQQAFKQQLLNQPQQQQPQPQQRSLQPTNKSVNDCSTSCGVHCAGNKQQTKPKDNCSTSCANLCKIYHPQPESITTNNTSTSTSTSKAVTPATARSFWDLSSFPSWSDLTPQQIKLEWSGMEPSAKEYIVCAYLPSGMTPSDSNISIDELSRLLTVKCETRSQHEEKDNNGHVISSRSQSNVTQRSIQIPADVDMRAISASKFPAINAETPQAQLILHMPKLQTSTPQPDNVKQIPIH